MKKQKMSLANIQGKMSRGEMKEIMAGDAPGAGCDLYNCGGCPSNCQCEDKPMATACIKKKTE